jgi:hypothetical protein
MAQLLPPSCLVLYTPRSLSTKCLPLVLSTYLDARFPDALAYPILVQLNFYLGCRPCVEPEYEVSFFRLVSQCELQLVKTILSGDLRCAYKYFWLSDRSEIPLNSLWMACASFMGHWPTAFDCCPTCDGYGQIRRIRRKSC